MTRAARPELAGTVLAALLCAFTGARAQPAERAPDTMEARVQGCATCHGKIGEGTNNGYFPRIAGKPAGYLYNQLVAFRDGRRRYPPMNYLARVPARPVPAEDGGVFRGAAPAVAAATRRRRRARRCSRAARRSSRRATRNAAFRPASAATAPRFTGMEPAIPGLVGLHATLHQRAARRLALRHAHRGRARLHADRRRPAHRGRHHGGRRVSRRAAGRRPIRRRSPHGTCACRSPAAASRTERRRACGVARHWRLASGSAALGAGARAARRCRHRAAPAPTPTLRASGASTSRAPATASPATRTPGGKLFAGGRPMPTPFGTLYSPNITPDEETGIGKWTADEFYRMMHTGHLARRRAALSGDAVRARTPRSRARTPTRSSPTCMSVPPVQQPNRPHELRFPFNKRELLLGWRTLYFKEGEYEPDPKQSANGTAAPIWSKGSAIARCATRAINALGGSSESKAFEGGMIPNQNWYAPSLTSNQRGRARRLEHQGHRRPAAGRRLARAARSTARWPRSSTTACNT